MVVTLPKILYTSPLFNKTRIVSPFKYVKTVQKLAKLKGQNMFTGFNQNDLPEFFMSAKPITNSQYEKFVKSTGHKKPGHWIGGVVPENRKDHPVTYIDWADANQFAKWCGARLPTEAEWEKSARGTDGRKFPWGEDEPTEQKANFEEEQLKLKVEQQAIYQEKLDMRLEVLTNLGCAVSGITDFVFYKTISITIKIISINEFYYERQRADILAWWLSTATR